MTTPRWAQGWRALSRFLAVAILAALLAVTIPADRTIEEAPPRPAAQPERVIACTPPGEHLCLGNPSDATPDVTHPENFLMEKTQYCLSYNRDRGEANWVAWHLDAGWIGKNERKDNFRPDESLPEGWYRVKGNDYSRTGYDQGHLCPSKDRTRTQEDNSASFLMTNMIPQRPRNNRVTWKNLEAYCQRMVLREKKELYIYAGGQGLQGTLAGGHLAVPNRTWKVILVLEAADGDDLARVDRITRVIAVDMPNDQKISKDWKQYRVSVDALEKKTGYDFFSRVPEEVQSAIEARVDDR